MAQEITDEVLSKLSKSQLELLLNTGQIDIFTFAKACFPSVEKSKDYKGNMLLKAILDTSEQHKIRLEFAELPKFQIGDIITANLRGNNNFLVRETIYCIHNYIVNCELIKPATYSDLDIKYLIPGIRFIRISKLVGEYDTEICTGIC